MLLDQPNVTILMCSSTNCGRKSYRWNSTITEKVLLIWEYVNEQSKGNINPVRASLKVLNKCAREALEQ